MVCELNNILASEINLIVLGLGGLSLLLLIWNTINSINGAKTKKKLEQLLRGSNSDDIERAILDNIERAESAAAKVIEMEKKMTEMKTQLENCVQRVDIVRYNAFSDTGSDLSYSLALLNNKNDGLLLTGIYGRNESYTYAKPINEGESKYALSDEETEVLRKAKNRRA